jgi:CPA1 family monovalent cation:H+ antiporter
VEITFTTVAAFGSFLLAEHLHVSGVLATLACGILLGNVGSLGAFSDEGRAAVLSFWEYAAFVANSLIFLLIGARIAHEKLLPYWMTWGLIVILLLLGRAVAVYGCSLLFARSRQRVKFPHQHVLFWGGLRGALSLALVFGLPAGIPHRDAISATAFAVVAFSVVVQGMTINPLIRRLQRGGRSGNGDEERCEAGVRSGEPGRDMIP